MHATQLQLPFDCLDFPGRATVTLAEIATKLGGSTQHYSNLIDDGTLTALDLTGHTGSRRMLRVPVDEYRRFVLACLTNREKRADFIGELPQRTLLEIRAEIDRRLAMCAA